MALATTNEFCDFGSPWELVHPRATADMLGYVPGFIQADDPRPARDQINARYGEHGGWRPNPGWQLRADSIIYPGDPPRPFVARTTHGDETINFYAGAYIAIVQPDGAFEIARID